MVLCRPNTHAPEKESICSARLRIERSAPPCLQGADGRQERIALVGVLGVNELNVVPIHHG